MMRRRRRVPSLALVLAIIAAGAGTVIAQAPPVQEVECSIDGSVVQVPPKYSFKPMPSPFGLRAETITDFDLLTRPGDAPRLVAVVSVNESERLVIFSSRDEPPETVAGSMYPAGTLREPTIGDFDDDGRLDVAALAPKETAAHIWLQRETGLFSQTTVTTTAPLSPLRILSRYRKAGRDMIAMISELPDGWGVVDVIGVGASGSIEVKQRQLTNPAHISIGVGRWLARSEDDYLHTMRGDFALYRLETETTMFSWGELPRFVPAPIRHVPADANGDGLLDLIVLGPARFGGWIIESRGTHAIERPLERSPTIDERVVLGRAGDLDDDGLTDLALLDGSGVTFHRNVPGALEGAVTVSANVEGSGKSMEAPVHNGRFAIRVPCKPVTLTARRAGVELSSVQVDASHGTRHTAHIAVPQPPNRTNVFSARGTGGPFVCLGYAPTSHGKWARRIGECPQMHAAVESDDTRHGGGLTCCPLPAADILLPESQWTSANECPANSIVTGAEMVSQEGKRVQRIHCTAIDTTRYALGERLTGIEWGTGRSSPGYQFGISRSELPLGLQPGLGRTGFNVWDIDGCIAPRPGAVQVTAPARRCSATAFRTIERRRGDGTTEPVEMFPRCVELVDTFDPEGGCTVR